VHGVVFQFFCPIGQKKAPDPQGLLNPGVLVDP
jgi:hypothetical protein